MEKQRRQKGRRAAPREGAERPLHQEAAFLRQGEKVRPAAVSPLRMVWSQTGGSCRPCRDQPMERARRFEVEG